MLSASKRFPVAFLCVWGVIGITGCGTVQPAVQHGQDASIERIHISALTEFVTDSDQPDRVQLKVLLELFDAFDSPVSLPCILRFELYEFHSVSSDPRGKRLVIWPEKDLNETRKAEEHWKALLRGYEFYLPLDFMPWQNKKYVLEATCFADQKRHNDLFKMEVSAVID